MPTGTQDHIKRRDHIISQPVGQQLIKLTIPMIFALFAIMGLGLVDSYFISFLGTAELAAIGFIVPVTTLINGIALGFGMAISSLTSRLIGANETEQAARLITDGFYLTSLIAIGVALLLYSTLTPLFTIIGANTSTLPAIQAYMHPWLFGAPLLMLSLVGSSTLRAIGDTKTSAKLAVVMTFSNMLLDPLLIFGAGPIPALGIQGAALATVIAVCLSCGFGVYQLAFKDQFIVWKLPQLSVFKNNCRQLFAIGIPSMLANLMIPIGATVLTAIVALQGTKAVAAFGVGSRIEAVSLAIIYALSSTLPMFIGQNLGANKPQRVHQAMRLSFKFTLLLQLAVWLLLWLLGKPIASQFSDDPEVQKNLLLFLSIVPLSYGLSGIVILINVSLNVLNKPRTALYINLIRLCFFYAPCAYLGAYYFGLIGLFSGIAIANTAAFLLAYKLLRPILIEQKIHS